MKIMSKTLAVSLCSAIMLGVVGVPGALADSNKKTSSSSSATATTGLTYVVAKNDSLTGIASKAKVKFNDLLAVNGFKSTSVILPGQVIKLPDTAVTVAPSANSATAAANSATQIAALIPDQTGHAGQFLKTDGSSTSWVVGGSGTVTSVGLSGGTTGLTASNTPVTTSGTITLGGTLAVANGGTGATTAANARTNLGLGSIATQFTRAAGNIQGELAACQRYYFRATASNVYTTFGVGSNYSTTATQIHVNHPVSMRIGPASVDYSTLALIDAVAGIKTFTTLTLSFTGPLTSMLGVTGSSGLVAGNSNLLLANNSTSGYLAFSAEL
jgi:LysM repeat protein